MFDFDLSQIDMMPEEELDRGGNLPPQLVEKFLDKSYIIR